MVDLISGERWRDELRVMSSTLEFYNSLILAQIHCDLESQEESEFFTNRSNEDNIEDNYSFE